ncbi:MAG: hypothetical protein HZB10_03350 [Candidatus Yonathbacteria bacterium]|nr:hypothetical protein [Candidatus Yonathbacteria bacterium]
MNTITLPKSKYVQILDTQEKLRGDLSRLQKIVFHIAEDSVNSKYLAKLSKIETGLSNGKGTKFRNKSEIKKFFASL